MKNTSALIILDGFGINPRHDYNAVYEAKTPNIDALMANYVTGSIGASGLSVGLPNGQMGNSEVGHTNIGAGRIVYQELTRISKAIDDGEFNKNPAFIKAIESAKAAGGKLNLLGLVSDGGVHSHMDHLVALVRMAKEYGIDAYINCFLDGRDVPPKSGIDYVADLEKQLGEIGHGRVATVMGRYYAMDRDQRWERVQKAYNAMVMGEGLEFASAHEAIASSYASDVTDEFVVPSVITENGKPIATINEGDAVIFFNFRPDRAREITRAIVDPDFTGFDRQKGFFKTNYVSMTQYDASFEGLLDIAFRPQSLAMTFGEYLGSLGMMQLRIAETEKYAHVTFFFNGGKEEPYPGEDRCLIPSPKVATYDLKPEMSAYEVADEAAKRVLSGKYDVMILNFANPDMVGHTGVMEAAVKAVEAVDECLGKVMDAIRKVGGRAIITADHGNAEQMINYETGEPYTQHTVSNPVPVIIADDNAKDIKLREDGCLADLVPTLIDLMGLRQPAEMTGKSLIIR